MYLALNYYGQDQQTYTSTYQNLIKLRSILCHVVQPWTKLNITHSVDRTLSLFYSLSLSLSLSSLTLFDSLNIKHCSISFPFLFGSIKYANNRNIQWTDSNTTKGLSAMPCQKFCISNICNVPFKRIKIHRKWTEL